MIGQPGIRACAEVSLPSSQRELETLLAESPEAASLRVLSHALPKDAPLVLYGAGNLGRSTAQRLRQAGVEPAAFADDTPGKQGQTLAGLAVLSVQAALEKFGAATVFIVTIHSPAASFLRVQRRLQQLSGARVISFLALAWARPDVFLPYLAFELPQQLLVKAPDIRRTFDLLADEESRRQFVAHLEFRLRLDFAALPRVTGNYFPADILASLPADVTFVDCGAFDGDTVRLFLAHQQGQFASIFAFEPDAGNYERLRAYVAGLDEPVRRRIVTSCAAVGARREQLAFNATGDTGAALSNTGDAQVNVVPLDEAIPNEPTPLFIKIDVEGAESEAIDGCAALIRDRSPVLAVSIYHRPDDLWQLPLALHSLTPSSRLFVRTLGEDGMDIVCYAVPPERISRSFDASRRSTTA
jgi:FkbM family methyltransferase